MNNFSFPPPPPPPPKAAPDPSYSNSYELPNTQRGRGGRGSSRGRGRGDFPGGRSGFASQSSFRGGYHQSNYLPQPYNNPQNHQTFYPPAPSYTQYPQTASSGVHYSFAGPGGQFMDGQSSLPYSIDSQALQNAAALVYTYPNLQFPVTCPQANYAQNHFQSPLSAPFQSAQSSGTDRFSGYEVPNEQATYGRKAESPSRGRPQSSFHNRPKTSVAPSVPGFGAPLPFAKIAPPAAASTARVQPTSNNESRKRKRKTNQLGLTPHGEEYEESEEEVDEEAAFGAKGGPVQIEYNGKVSVLGNTTDIKEWIEERRKRWPTKARVEEKQKEAVKRQAEQAEARRKVQESQAQARSQRKQEMDAKTQQVEAEARAQRKKRSDAEGVTGKQGDDKLKREMEKHIAKAEKLRKKLKKVEKTLAGQIERRPIDPAPTNAAKQERVAGPNDKGLSSITPVVGTGDEGPQPDPTAATNPASPSPSTIPLTAESVIVAFTPEDTKTNSPKAGSPALLTSSASRASNPDSESDSDSESDLDSDSDLSDTSSSASAPEEETAKSTGPIRVPTPPRTKKGPICKYFARKGHCRHGDNCNFRHELPDRTKQALLRNKKEPVKKERKTLHQRLVEQEQVEENRLALQAIKYLGEHGFFDDGGGKA